jgi:hypothetical protein
MWKVAFLVQAIALLVRRLRVVVGLRDVLGAARAAGVDQEVDALLENLEVGLGRVRGGVGFVGLVDVALVRVVTCLREQRSLVFLLLELGRLGRLGRPATSGNTRGEKGASEADPEQSAKHPAEGSETLPSAPLRAVGR